MCDSEITDYLLSPKKTYEKDLTRIFFFLLSFISFGKKRRGKKNRREANNFLNGKLSRLNGPKTSKLDAKMEDLTSFLATNEPL